MQVLDLRHDVRRQRQARLEECAASRVSCVRRTAVEAKPGFRLEQLTVAVDEIRDPERSIEQIDRHLSPCGKPQQLSLNPHAFPGGYQHVLLRFGATVRRGSAGVL